MLIVSSQNKLNACLCLSVCFDCSILPKFDTEAEYDAHRSRVHAVEPICSPATLDEPSSGDLADIDTSLAGIDFDDDFEASLGLATSPAVSTAVHTSHKRQASSSFEKPEAKKSFERHVESQLVSTPDLTRINLVFNNVYHVFCCLSCESAIAPTAAAVRGHWKSCQTKQGEDALVPHGLSHTLITAALAVYSSAIDPRQAVSPEDKTPVAGIQILRDGQGCSECHFLHHGPESIKKHYQSAHPNKGVGKKRTNVPIQRLHSTLPYYEVTPELLDYSSTAPLIQFLQQVTCEPPSTVIKPSTDQRELHPVEASLQWMTRLAHLDAVELVQSVQINRGADKELGWEAVVINGGKEALRLWRFDLTSSPELCLASLIAPEYVCSLPSHPFV